MENDVILRLTGVGMSWGDRRVLRDVGFELNEGDFMVITGPNGGGKTTLLRIMLGLLKPTEGCVGWLAHGSSIGYLPQKNLIDARFPITVEEVVSSGLLGVSGLTAGDRKHRVARMLDKMELHDMRHATIGNLSGGQLQRTMMGRALVADPAVIVLDEPLSYIDSAFEQRVYSLLMEEMDKKTIVMVTHRTEPVERLATRHLTVDCRVSEVAVR